MRRAWFLGVMALAGCGRLGFEPLPADAALDAPTLDAPSLDAPGLDAPGLDAPGLDAPSDAGPEGCSFGVSNAFAPVGSSDGEYQLTMSRDGLVVCFTRSVGGDPDIWCARRGSRAGTFSTPRAETAINLAGVTDRMPALSADGSTLYFSSDRGGGAGSEDVYVSAWDAAAGAYAAPTNVAIVNGAQSELAPELSTDGLTLFIARGPAGGPWRTHVSTRASAGDPFGAPNAVSGLAVGDSELAVAGDGVHAVFCTQRPTPGVPSGTPTLWCATLSGASATVIGPVAASLLLGSCSPAIGPDGELYYNASDVPGGGGGSDIVVALP